MFDLTVVEESQENHGRCAPEQSNTSDALLDPSRSDHRFSLLWSIGNVYDLVPRGIIPLLIANESHMRVQTIFIFIPAVPQPFRDGMAETSSEYLQRNTDPGDIRNVQDVLEVSEGAFLLSRDDGRELDVDNAEWVMPPR